MNQASTYGRSQLSLESARPEDSGNYTCTIEAGDILDSISYALKVQGTSTLICIIKYCTRYAGDVKKVQGICWHSRVQGMLELLITRYTLVQYSQVQGTLLKYRYTVVNGLLVYIVKCKVYADFEVFVLYTCYIYFKENTYYLVVIHDTFFNMTLRALYKLLIRNIMYSTVFSGFFF